MPQAPKISVVTASFNALEGLKATVSSVAAQSITFVEHIIIDGGSSDGTREYLQGLGDQVLWVSEPDKGIADALNKGIAMAHGEWILILQAEDVLLSNDALETAIGELSPTLDMVAFQVLLATPDCRHTVLPSRPLGFLTNIKMTSPHQGLFVKRAFYADIGTFDADFRIAMDYEFLLRAKRIGVRHKAIDRPLSIMPATGISTLADWHSIDARLKEDRRLQRRHIRSVPGRAANSAFWAVYRPFKRLKASLT